MKINKQLLSKITAAAIRGGQRKDTAIATTREVNGKLIVDLTISRPLETGRAVLPIGYISATLDPADAQDAYADFSLGRFIARV